VATAGKPPFDVHPGAEAELAAAARFYDERRPGLGDDYLREMQRLIDFALGHPEAGAPVEEGVRWLLSQRFPYAVVYRWRTEHLQVLSFAHLRRRPGYWRSRAAG
jgi:toxin ParE1/3/4